jgi:hypothetical protein
MLGEGIDCEKMKKRLSPRLLENGEDLREDRIEETAKVIALLCQFGDKDALSSLSAP